MFLKAKPIKGKLEPAYRGPYTIEKSLPNGNYQLVNKFNKMLSTSYPLSKLKVADAGVEIDEETNEN